MPTYCNYPDYYRYFLRYYFIAMLFMQLWVQHYLIGNACKKDRARKALPFSDFQIIMYSFNLLLGSVSRHNYIRSCINFYWFYTCRYLCYLEI